MLAAAVVLYDVCMASRAVADNWQNYAGQFFCDTQGNIITVCAAAPIYLTVALQVVSRTTPCVHFMWSQPCI